MNGDLLLINQTRLAQNSKKFLNVTNLLHRNVVTYLNIKDGNRVFATPGKQDFIYLLEYYLVGNIVDLATVLPKIDVRLTSHDLLDQIIQAYGIDRTNWSTDPRVDDVINQELSAISNDIDDLLN